MFSNVFPKIVKFEITSKSVVEPETADSMARERCMLDK